MELFTYCKHLWNVTMHVTREYSLTLQGEVSLYGLLCGLSCFAFAELETYYLFGQIQTSQTGGQPYSNNSPPSWWVFSGNSVCSMKIKIIFEPWALSGPSFSLTLSRFCEFFVSSMSFELVELRARQFWVDLKPFGSREDRFLTITSRF